MPKGKSGSQAGGERVAIQSEDLKGLESLGAQELLAWSLERFGENIALACSFGGEDVVLVDMLSKLSPNPRVFAIDTGRLHEATYEVMEQIREKYGLKLEIYFPSRGEVEELVRNKGLYSFRTSLEARKECCRIRKVDPLNRALKGLQAWITGLRRDQSVTRTELSKVEVDGAHGGILKLNPLADWSSEEIWEYIRANEVPFNVLHDLGYPSIGCEPCTRAVLPGEHARAGRWWWEDPANKECGLHVKGGEQS